MLRMSDTKRPESCCLIAGFFMTHKKSLIDWTSRKDVLKNTKFQSHSTILRNVSLSQVGKPDARSAAREGHSQGLMKLQEQLTRS